MATWSVVADIDSTLDKFDPDANLGSHTDLICSVFIIGGSKVIWDRAIMNFDLSGFPGAVADITSAKLTVFVIANSDIGELVRFERCTRPADWVEMEVTWNEYNSGNSWVMFGGDLTQTDRVTTTDSGSGAKDIPGFKTLVEDAINNRSDILSLIMRMDDEDEAGDTRQHSIRSSEHADPARKPTLEITYGVATSRRRMLVQAIG